MFWDGQQSGRFALVDRKPVIHWAKSIGQLGNDGLDYGRGGRQHRRLLARRGPLFASAREFHLNAHLLQLSLCFRSPLEIV